MKTSTIARNINGSWYLLIKPQYAEWLELTGEHGTSHDMEIQDDDGKHGKYISGWKRRRNMKTA
jgi:hypothetical protein